VNAGDEGPWTAEVRALLEPLWEAGRHPALVEGRRAEALEDHPGFAPVRRLEMSIEDEVDRDGMLAWFASFSVVGALPAGEGGARARVRRVGPFNAPERGFLIPPPADTPVEPSRRSTSSSMRPSASPGSRRTQTARDAKVAEPAGRYPRTSPSARAHCSVRRSVSSTGV
jgi:hypothetical protein